MSTIVMPELGEVRSKSRHSAANTTSAAIADMDQMNTLEVNELNENTAEYTEDFAANDVDSSEANAASAQESHKTFAELGVPEPLVRVLKADGKTTAFPIQEDTLPDSLSGRDILGRGRTGSGKTLAFVLPTVARLAASADDHRDTRSARDRRALPAPRGLILAPTRELANQIDEVLTPLARAYRIETCTIYGGVRQSRQVNDLRSGAQIVVACPGRLEDLLRQGLLTLDDVEITVLDEADEMSDMGFLPAVERILSQVREDGQHMLFSATLDHGVDAVVKRYLHNAKVHEVDSATQQVDLMTHHIFETTQGDKHELVRKLASGMGKRIFFTRTKFQAKKLADNLTKVGIPAAELHGNLSQNQRDRNLNAFSGGEVRVLVATDVAARGVDVSGVDLVVQVDPPADPKSFLHRSGRTARAGKAGDVVTLVLPNQRRDTKRLLRIAHIDAKPVGHVTADSGEVEALVGETAPIVEGWTLAPLRPARTGGSGSGRGRGGRGGNRGGERRDGGRRGDRRDGGRDGGRRNDFHKGGFRRDDRDDFAGERRSNRYDRGERGERNDRSDRNDRNDFGGERGDFRRGGNRSYRSHDSRDFREDRGQRSGGYGRNKGRDFNRSDDFGHDGPFEGRGGRGDRGDRYDRGERSERGGRGDRDRSYGKGKGGYKGRSDGGQRSRGSYESRDSYRSHDSHGSRDSRDSRDGFESRGSRNFEGGRGKSRNPRYDDRGEGGQGGHGGHGERRQSAGFQHRTNRSKRSSNPFRGSRNK
ncbi:hypothetical protein KIMH_01150 [Bombiscardovia apis]|uniref:ATP-dependent RNA helicase n=2 Tax=Bombiscardovia apis TaxID=2932182 RepID=A0ABN6SD50_9BIFI|nr:hypothetical protein KIMH_01150 [Bombiscardovia apis]